MKQLRKAGAKHERSCFLPKTWLFSLIEGLLHKMWFTRSEIKESGSQWVRGDVIFGIIYVGGRKSVSCNFKVASSLLMNAGLRDSEKNDVSFICWAV